MTRILYKRFRCLFCTNFPLIIFELYLLFNEMQCIWSKFKLKYVLANYRVCNTIIWIIFIQRLLQIVIFCIVNSKEINLSNQFLIFAITLIFGICKIYISRGFLAAMEEEDYEFYIGENARAGSVYISEINCS